MDPIVINMQHDKRQSVKVFSDILHMLVLPLILFDTSVDRF